MKDSSKARSAKKAKPSKQLVRSSTPGNKAKDRRPTNVIPIVDSGDAPKLPAVAIERVKLVRDSFTMPRDDFDLIAKLKSRALEFKRPTKKSELLRAGLQQLAALDEEQLRAALAALRPLQTGRPKKAR